MLRKIHPHKVQVQRLIPISAAAAHTGADVSTDGLTEIAAFIDGAALPLWTGTMVTM
jgi:hypothetical protein